MQPNPYAPPSSSVVAEPPPIVPPTDGPVGLSGWLVLVGIGVVVSPLRLAYFLLQTYLPMFRDGTWETVTTPGSASYHPFWGPLLLGEIIVNSAFILMSIYLLYLFFRKSSRFPKTYVVFLIANFSFILADAFAAQVVLPDQPVLDPQTGREFGRAVFAAVVWIPYMLVSKRVKNTFVRTDA
jgi:hypothetical protein